MFNLKQFADKKPQFSMEELVEAFLTYPKVQACSSVHGGYGNCGWSAGEFARFCRRCGYQARIVRISVEGKYPKADPRWSRVIGPATHYATEIKDHGIYDWCFRQFDPESPFPKIWPNGKYTILVGYDEPVDFWGGSFIKRRKPRTAAKENVRKFHLGYCAEFAIALHRRFGWPIGVFYEV